LGPYEIVAAIAAGGMGEVYRARDARLQRDVAIKVLPDVFATDPDRRARFEREARAVAALSHPNILSIFDVGVQGQTAYAVTELLEGETLREQLVSGSLPLRKAVDYGVQIARGLGAAHDKGIVHRDLKPENLFVLSDGRVKILDFGIARSVLTEGPTMIGATDPGAVLGTVGYMAPEQIRGNAIDQRADLFALGAVIYEMLSGRRAFQRETAAETMTAILREDPPEMTDVRAPLPPGLDRIVRHCLEKNPAERFQSARDVAFALDALSGTATAKLEGPGESARRRPRWMWPAAAAVLVLVAAPAGFVAGRRGAAAGPPGVVKFETKTFDPQLITNARFMPDGQTIVFSSAMAGNIPDLYVARANTAAPQALGPTRTHLLSISSSGELAVLTGVTLLAHRLYSGTLARMTLDSAPRSWMEHVREADWAPNGSDIAIVREASHVDHLEFPAGHELYQTSGYVSDPRVSPDGRRVAFVDHSARFDDRGWVKVVDGKGTVTTLTEEFWGIEGLAWTPDGTSVVFSAATGGVQGYQAQIVPASGERTARQLLPSAGSTIVEDAAKDGRYILIRVDDRLGLRAFTPALKDERDLSWLNSSLEPRLSRDAKLLLFTDQSEFAGATYSTSYRTVDGGPVARLGEGSSAGLSPDGRWALAVVPSSPPRTMLYPIGPGAPVQLNSGGLTRESGTAGWFPDSRRVFFCGTKGSQPPRCYQQNVDGGTPEPLTPAGYSGASVAPDGRTMLLRATDNTWHLGEVGGGIQPMKGLSEREFLISWTADSQAVYVQREQFSPVVNVERVEIATGARKTVRQIGIPGAASIGVLVGDYRDDGSYAYFYWNRPTTMFVVSGLNTKP